MKTMRKGKELPIRVGEDQVQDKLDEGYNFCEKKEWKAEVRDAKAE